MNVKRLIFASLVLVALLFACQPPGGPAIGGGDLEDPTPSEKYSLTVSTEANGEIIDYDLVITPKMDSYPAGTDVEISIPYTPGYKFVSWTGDVNDEDIYNVTINITMDSKKELKAIMQEVNTTITGISYIWTDENGDSITPPSSIPSLLVSPEDYNELKLELPTVLNQDSTNNIELINIPDGWNFSSLEIANLSTRLVRPDAILTTNITSFEDINAFFISKGTTGSAQIVATFTKIPTIKYSVSYYIGNTYVPNPLTAIPDAHGSITPSTGNTLEFDEPTEITLTVIPDANYIADVGVYYVSNNEPHDISKNVIDNSYTFTVDAELRVWIRFLDEPTI